jgi:hypothetical protein
MMTCEDIMKTIYINVPRAANYSCNSLCEAKKWNAFCGNQIVTVSAAVSVEGFFKFHILELSLK